MSLDPQSPLAMRREDRYWEGYTAAYDAILSKMTASLEAADGVLREHLSDELHTETWHKLACALGAGADDASVGKLMRAQLVKLLDGYAESQGTEDALEGDSREYIPDGK